MPSFISASTKYSSLIFIFYNILKINCQEIFTIFNININKYMSLKLSKTNIIPYNYYSIGNNLNPILAQTILDYNNPVTYSDIITTYLVATENVYTGISLQIVDEEIGINWMISFDNINWYKTINLINIDARENDVIRMIYFRVAMLNDGTVIDGQYIQCNINIIATEIYK